MSPSALGMGDSSIKGLSNNLLGGDAFFNGTKKKITIQKEGSFRVTNMKKISAVNLVKSFDYGQANKTLKIRNVQTTMMSLPT